MTLKEYKEFMDRPGINKSGIAKEAGINKFYLSAVYNELRPLTKKFVKRIEPVMRKYGYKMVEIEQSRLESLLKIEKRYYELQDKILEVGNNIKDSIVVSNSETMS